MIWLILETGIDLLLLNAHLMLDMILFLSEHGEFEDELIAPLSSVMFGMVQEVLAHGMDDDVATKNGGNQVNTRLLVAEHLDQVRLGSQDVFEISELHTSDDAFIVQVSGVLRSPSANFIEEVCQEATIRLSLNTKGVYWFFGVLLQVLLLRRLSALVAATTALGSSTVRGPLRRWSVRHCGD